MADVEAHVMYDVLHDHNYRKVWDDNMLSGIVIEQLNATNEVGYYAAKSPGPISNRDFVNQRVWRADADKGEWLIINWSVQHDDYPEKKGFVRAQSILSGYMMRRSANGGTDFTFVSQTDPKGWIPTWVVNSVTGKLAPRVAKMLHEVTQKYPEWKKDNKPEWKPWLGTAGGDGEKNDDKEE
jgi:StAR-related lipid transfer protein 10